jgi:Gaa1-like, GPI transamidase component
VVTGILRAGKGDGTEGIVLSALFTHQSSVNYTRAHLGDALSSEAVGGVGVLLSIADFLRSRKWLAKDIPSFYFILPFLS